MYAYTEFDRHFVHQRAAQYRDQLQRNLAGQLSDDDFRPLRLQNGWDIQRHAPMLRIAVPYGELNSTQMRALARIARDFDRGYGHFTTRQNLQFNWIPLVQSADVMKVLVGGGMGRTPIIGTVAHDFLPWQQMLVFIEAVVRVYNRYGRRDNLYKARIKILVKAEGQKFIDDVNEEFKNILERDLDGSAHIITQAE